MEKAGPLRAGFFYSFFLFPSISKYYLRVNSWAGTRLT